MSIDVYSGPLPKGDLADTSKCVYKCHWIREVRAICFSVDFEDESHTIPQETLLNRVAREVAGTCELVNDREHLWLQVADERVYEYENPFLQATEGQFNWVKDAADATPLPYVWACELLYDAIGLTDYCESQVKRRSEFQIDGITGYLNWQEVHDSYTDVEHM